jgi:hypothetical protein
VTKISIPPEPYFDEYAPAAETIRLDTPPYLSLEWAAHQTEQLDTAPITTRITPLLIAVERSLASAYAAGVLLVCGGAGLGWVARGLWGPLSDQRGWAALVVFSIVGSVWMVNERNRGR